MGFQDVAFLSSRASFSTTFLKNRTRGENLRITICHKTVVGGKQVHDPCEMLWLQQSLFLVQSNFMDIIRRWGYYQCPVFHLEE